MITCRSCGTEYEGRYCPNCGTPAEPASERASGERASGATAGVPPPEQAEVNLGIPSNIAGVLCYLVPIAGPLVFLLLAPYNRDSTVRFNAWQALFLQLVFFAIHLVLGVFTGSSSGDFSYRFFLLVSELLNLAYLALVVVMCIKAYQNRRVSLPWIGPFAASQK